MKYLSANNKVLARNRGHVPSKAEGSEERKHWDEALKGLLSSAPLTKVWPLHMRQKSRERILPTYSLRVLTFSQTLLELTLRSRALDFVTYREQFMGSQVHYSR